MSSTHAPSMTPEELLEGWQPRRVGRRVEVYAEVDSTNSRALARADKPDADGLVLFSDYQTAGRGRLGRQWQAPRRAGLLGSAILIERLSAGNDQERHEQAVRMGGRLTLLAALAVCRAIRSTTTVNPAIKWPNDIRLGTQKLAGILIESRMLPGGDSAWIVGVGINCHQQKGHFPSELREVAGSLDLLCKNPIDRTSVARALLQAMDDYLADPQAMDQHYLHQQWLDHAESIGQKVRLRSEGREYQGHTLEVDPAGGLIVQCSDNVRRWFDPMLTSLL